MREEDLTEQFVQLMDRLDLNETGLKVKFEDELKRFNKFHRGVLGVKGKAEAHQDIDLRDYAKYVLREGSNEEKRELMGCFRSSISLKNKAISLPQHRE